MQNNFANRGGYTNPQAVTPIVNQQAGDPNWPAWFFHADGRSRMCRTEREASEQCPGWSPKPLPPPEKPIGPMPAEKVAEAIAAAVKTAVNEQRIRFEAARDKAREQYSALQEKYEALQLEYNALLAAKNLTSDTVSAPAEPNIFDLA